MKLIKYKKESTITTANRFQCWSLVSICVTILVLKKHVPMSSLHSVPPCDWSSWSIRIRILEYYLYYLLVVCSAGVYEKGYWRVYTHTKCGSTSPYFELHIIPTITIVEMIFSLSRLFYLSVEENGILQQQMEYNISSHNILLYFISSYYYITYYVWYLWFQWWCVLFSIISSSPPFAFSSQLIISSFFRIVISATTIYYFILFYTHSI